MCHKGIKHRIAVFVSGGGTNLESLLLAQEEGFFQSEIVLVVSNKEDAYALERGRNHGIETYVEKDWDSLESLLKERQVDLIVLAGYLKILGSEILEQYKNRIINIHPSLLPKFGGKGMYGMNVHRSVFEAKEKMSGATVHLVNKEIDGGKILLQTAINIEKCSSPEEIQKAVLYVEHEALKTAIRLYEEDYV
ncbi:phosphoribosylglycinamide formyltransferase [Peptoniphilus sp. KCTC 25270]|uniref:phosphoribosylglycinamide formyltransferase n=1 Tax=Peptoniphilus sp. KCTC 25270 TaxID=2897414 RepID=UPI001E3FE790|nr:phosphoribosylglycinamide formyltransferase [Peptoniphilus sp. KCTC 25270]MCD1146654.1 phosphoribosylglycinamide formyltransferase [Peptoniphilus sp. KCTC 25270]